MQRLFEGGAYLSKYGNPLPSFTLRFQRPFEMMNFILIGSTNNVTEQSLTRSDLLASAAFLEAEVSGCSVTACDTRWNTAYRKVVRIDNIISK